jgi:hypothetical protein
MQVNVNYGLRIVDEAIQLILIEHYLKFVGEAFINALMLQALVHIFSLV